MNTKLQMTDIMERLKQKPRRKSPTENPALAFRAAMQIMYTIEGLRADLSAEYDLRREHFKEVKIPQNNVASDNLMNIGERAEFERLCKVLFDSQDDATAAAILHSLGKEIGDLINRQLADVIKKEINVHENPEKISVTNVTKKSGKIIAVMGYRTHDIVAYANEYLDHDILTELCAQEIHLSAPKAAQGMAEGALLLLGSEWPEGNADKYMERNRLVSSYSNKSEFYNLCKEAMADYAATPFLPGDFFHLPYSDKRAHVIQEEWTSSMDFTKIADEEEAAGANKVVPAHNVADDIEKILHGSEYLKEKGTKKEADVESASVITVKGYISILVARFAGFIDISRQYAYAGLVGMRLPTKAGKDILNQAFLLAEQLGMETRDDKKITFETKQFILTNIAQELMKWGTYEYLRSGSDAAKNEDDDSIGKTSEAAAGYMNGRYEELLAENEKLRKELEKKEDSDSAKKMVSKEEVKELRAQLSEKDRQLEELKGELESIKQENDNLYDLFDLENDAQEPLPTLSDESEVERALESKRILVWGCRPDFGRKWEGRYSNLVISVTNGRKTEKLTQTQLANYDGVIIQTNYCSHGMYEGAKNAIQNAHLPYVHIRKYDNNDAVFMQSIIKVCQMVDEREALKEGDQS